MVKAILFDFWGTLVDNGARGPTKGTLQILRVPVEYKDFIGRFETVFFTQSFPTQEDAFKAVCDSFNVRPYPIVISKLIGLWNKNKLFAKAYPETVEVLAHLKSQKIKLAVVSNTNQDAVEEILEKLGLSQYFDAVVLSYKHGVLKQDGELYEIALKELGVAKKDALVVGDALETDIEGANKAGIKSILLDRRNTREYTPKIALLTELEAKL